MSLTPPGNNPARSHPSPPGPAPTKSGIQYVLGDIDSGGVIDLRHQLVACSGCGAVFSRKVVERKSIRQIADVLKMDTNGLPTASNAYPDVTCPLCLTTQGWEDV